jgi:hypothetical protein
MRYRGEPYLSIISITSTLIHPGRGSPRVSLANNEFGEWCEDDFGLSLELEEN